MIDTQLENLSLDELLDKLIFYSKVWHAFQRPAGAIIVLNFKDEIIKRFSKLEKNNESTTVS